MALSIVYANKLQIDRVILASQSAQRLALLQQIGIEPVCIPANVDETPHPNESAEHLVERLAILKASSCFTSDGYASLQSPEQRCFVMGADTVIDLNGTILGKPENEDHGIEMLQRLSGQEHRVHSGVCLLTGSSAQPQSVVVTTQIRFGDLPVSVLRSYWATGEPRGKAGGYAIQGRGAQFVQSLTGSYSNVVGLPLYETSALLRQADYSLL